nr:hypothetical protein [Nocardiopsis quinghaiensis]
MAAGPQGRRSARTGTRHGLRATPPYWSRPRRVPTSRGQGRHSGQGTIPYRANAIPPSAIARAVAFAVEQPDDVDVNEIVVRPAA